MIELKIQKKKLINLLKFFLRMSNQMKLQVIKYNHGGKRLVKILRIKSLLKNCLIRMIRRIGKVFY